MKTKLLLTFSLSILLEGCCLFGVGEIGNATYTSPDLLRDSLFYEIPNKELSVVRRSWREPRVNQLDILHEWGSPNEIIYVNDKVQEWKYKRGLRWRGLIFMAIAPIPVGVPTGRETVTFIFSDENLSSYTINTDRWCVSYAGLILLPGIESPPPGFVASHACKSQLYYLNKKHCSYMFYDGCPTEY